MKKYVCIHGHYYQPPRENPWLEAIEIQDSAYPFHDWNERITAESYAANGASRLLNEHGRIRSITNNYALTSFNFGPTLLSWLEDKRPDVYQYILDADRQSQSRFSGHGSALAQVYNHIIMPLANTADRHTQVIWGIQDFQHRFGRPPEGMWLAETAVDIETLEILAEYNIKFTVLAPRQAARVRPMDTDNWVDVSDESIDPKRAYRQNLPSGNHIDLFFYDGPISRGVAFERLLNKGETFANRLLGVFSDNRDQPQLVHIATDGETYGHHHRHGDMGLAYALRYIEDLPEVELTIYGEYLEKHPPDYEVQILEKTSWSCAHGIGRWWTDCGCNSGGKGDWNQQWRTPLRNALDHLRDTTSVLFEDAAGELVKDPWEARNDYIKVLMNRDSAVSDEFVLAHQVGRLSAEERVRLFKLLELQRHAMLMYTSCGWFFDDITGIETIQIIQYAGRLIQLAQELFDEAAETLEEDFLLILEKAVSNTPLHENGREIYERTVRPAKVDLLHVGAHYVISSLFESYKFRTMEMFSYEIELDEQQYFETGATRMVLGHGKFRSRITGDTAQLTFGALHLGDIHVSAGVREFRGDAEYEATLEEARDVFEKMDFADVIRMMDRRFGASTYSLKSLFRDEQRKVTNNILKNQLEEAQTAYRQIYERHAGLIRFLGEIGMPQPKPFAVAGQIVLNQQLRDSLSDEFTDAVRIRRLLRQAHIEQLELDDAGLAYIFEQRIESNFAQLLQKSDDLPTLGSLQAATSLLPDLKFNINLWKSQNSWFFLQGSVYPEMESRSAAGDSDAESWCHLFEAIGQNIGIAV